MLPRFDTGHWSRYSLGAESTLEYHDYVDRPAEDRSRKRTADPIWTDTLGALPALRDASRPS